MTLPRKEGRILSGHLSRSAGASVASARVQPSFPVLQWLAPSCQIFHRQKQPRLAIQSNWILHAPALCYPANHASLPRMAARSTPASTEIDVFCPQTASIKAAFRFTFEEIQKVCRPYRFMASKHAILRWSRRFTSSAQSNEDSDSAGCDGFKST